MRKVKVRNWFNYDVERASVESGLGDFSPSLTKQEFRDDADINVMVKRFGIGALTATSGLSAPVYADFTGVSDNHSALNTVRAAAEAFMALPSSVRAEFGNDPQQLVVFCSDPANAEAAAKLGLTDPLVVPQGPPAVQQSAALVAAPAASNPSAN